MNNKHLLSLLLILMFSFVSAQKFEINGFVSDGNLEKIYFSYEDINGKNILDSANIKHQEFQLKGEINTFSKINICDNKKGIWREKNYFSLYTLPQKSSFYLNVNDFRKSQTKGNLIQNQFNDYKKSNDNHYKALSNNYKKLKNAPKEREDSLYELKEKIKYDIVKNKVNYITKNQNELSLFLMEEVLISKQEKKFREEIFNAFEQYKKHQNTLLYQRIKKNINAIRRNREGEIITSFQFQDIENKILYSDKLLRDNQFLLIEFWASWCKPCREDNIGLLEIYKTFENKGFEVISISKDRNENRWKKAILKDGISDWKHAVINKENDFLLNKFNIGFAIPIRILIDTNHKIIRRWRGSGSNEELKLILEKKLKTNDK